MAQIVRITHEDNSICKVPVYNFPGKHVTLEQDDLETLLTLGVNMVWKLSNGVVWTQNGAKRISVARLICDALAGQQVYLRDRNPFNLIRSNMVITPGRAKYRARDKIDLTPPRLRREVIIEHIVN